MKLSKQTLIWSVLLLGLMSLNGRAAVLMTLTDSVGPPFDSGTYSVGDTITLNVNIQFTNPPADAASISYWFGTNPVSSGYFSLTSRTIGASPFNQLPSSPSFPEVLDPTTNTDLGALTASNLSPGTYFVSTVTFSVNPAATPGTYSIFNTTTGAMTSVLGDSNANSFAIPAATYTVTVVPEPGSLTLVAAGLLGCLMMLRRSRLSVP